MQPLTTSPPLDPDRGAAFALPGGSPGVLLVHGFASTPWEIRPVAAALEHAGYGCAAPLLPGHGRTPADLAATRWRDWQRAVDDAIARLARAHDQIVLLGMSLGSLLVLDAASRWQDRADLRGVVTLACPLRLARVPQTVLAVARALGPALPNVYVAKRRGSDVRDAAARAQNPGYRTQPLRAAREMLVAQRTARAALPTLRVPLLAIHGLLDRTAPLASTYAMLSRVGSRDTTLFVAGHSGHLVGVDVDREAVAQTVVAFVKRIARGG